MTQMELGKEAVGRAELGKTRQGRKRRGLKWQGGPWRRRQGVEQGLEAVAPGSDGELG